MARYSVKTMTRSSFHSPLGEADLADPIHQPLRLGVCSAPAIVGPDAHLVEDRLSHIDARRPRPHPCEHRLLLFVIDVGKRSRGQGKSLLLLVRHRIGVVSLVFEGGQRPPAAPALLFCGARPC